MAAAAAVPVVVLLLPDGGSGGRPVKKSGGGNCHAKTVGAPRGFAKATIDHDWGSPQTFAFAPALAVAVIVAFRGIDLL